MPAPTPYTLLAEVSDISSIVCPEQGWLILSGAKCPMNPSLAHLEASGNCMRCIITDYGHFMQEYKKFKRHNIADIQQDTYFYPVV